MLLDKIKKGNRKLAIKLIIKNKGSSVYLVE